MPYSSGTYDAPASSWNPAVAETQINVADWIALLADIETALTTCLLKDGSQAATAAIPFASGITVSGGATLATYTTGSTSSTFTWDGTGGTSGAVTLTWQRIGNWVTLNIPAVAAASGTSSANFTSDTAIAAGARPGTTQVAPIEGIRNNGATLGPTGYISISNLGILNISRDAAATAFTDASSCGTASATSVTYYAG